jgi:hypothetical protein
VVGRGRAGAWPPSLARTSLVRLSVESRVVMVVLVLVLGEGGTGVVPRAERRVERTSRLVVSDEEEAEGGEGLVSVVLLLLLLAVVVSVVSAICTSLGRRGEGEKGRRKVSKGSSFGKEIHSTAKARRSEGGDPSILATEKISRKQPHPQAQHCIHTLHTPLGMAPHPRRWLEGW